VTCGFAGSSGWMPRVDRWHSLGFRAAPPGKEGRIVSDAVVIPLDPGQPRKPRRPRLPRPGGGAATAITEQIIEAVTGQTFWDYMREHVFGHAGMTGSDYYTRDRWLTDEHIAHPYMNQPDGSRVDAVRNLDKDSLSQQGPGENPGRGFVDYVFATTPDLVRFAEAVRDGTLLGRPYADLYTAPHRPGRGEPTSYSAYSGPNHIINGNQWVSGRGGGSDGVSGGVSANWNIYRDAGWVGLILSNYDDTQEFGEMLNRDQRAITGQG
jgi:CubicO group peptidase (beta-lactamase class C family)